MDSSRHRRGLFCFLDFATGFCNAVTVVPLLVVLPLMLFALCRGRAKRIRGLIPAEDAPPKAAYAPETSGAGSWRREPARPRARPRPISWSG